MSMLGKNQPNILVTWDSRVLITIVDGITTMTNIARTILLVATMRKELLHRSKKLDHCIK
jgi:hypothetical protein